jgi:hypothetical protein
MYKLKGLGSSDKESLTLGAANKTESFEGIFRNQQEFQTALWQVAISCMRQLKTPFFPSLSLSTRLRLQFPQGAPNRDRVYLDRMVGLEKGPVILGGVKVLVASLRKAILDVNPDLLTDLNDRNLTSLIAIDREIDLIDPMFVDFRDSNNLKFYYPLFRNDGSRGLAVPLSGTGVQLGKDERFLKSSDSTDIIMAANRTLIEGGALAMFYNKLALKFQK